MSPKMVSIHAPVKGATAAELGIALKGQCFNSRTRKGCDKNGALPPRQRAVSIHAPVKGATAVGPVLVGVYTLFQFTHP